MRRVAVIGGGISGLAAAYELATSAPDLEIVVHEATDRAGGKLHTTPFAGRAVDEGADAFLARVPWALDLCRELGIDGELVSPATGSAFVWSAGALRRLPAGLVLGVPTDLDALAASGIVSEPVTPRPTRALQPDEDVSVGALVRQQLGDQVLERLVDPLLGGIHAGNADDLSIRAAAPQLAAAAERGPDLLAALRAQPPAAPGPVFFSPRGGMGALVDALLAALDVKGVDVRLGSAVHDVVDDVDADAIVLAVPAHVAAPMLRDRARAAAEALAAIEHASVALVTFAFPRAGVDHALDGSGYLVPRTEGLLLTAASWATTKWAYLDRDDGRVVVRASAGRAGEDRIASLDDAQLVARLRADLALTMGARAEPDEVRVSRWPNGFPQYAPGHLDRIDAIEAELAHAMPRLVLTGAMLRGIGVPACIREGRAAARRLLGATHP